MTSNWKWLLQMAWRDARKNKGRLFLFMSSIVLGIAALVAINSFSDNLKSDIDNEAKELTGADLIVRSRQPISDSLRLYFDSLAINRAKEVSFASMIYFPKTQGTRLMKVRALEGDFPFYGEIETSPVPAAAGFRNAQQALVDNSVLIQFQSAPGDPVRIGNIEFEIAGSLLQAPGEVGLGATIAPSAYMPMRFLEQTGLIKKGSRINYEYYFLYPEGTDVKELAEAKEDAMDKEGLRYETVERRKRDVGRTFSNLTDFLNLSGFIALLLGCVGVASSVHIYVKEKVSTVAVLRCLGMSGWQAFFVFLAQIAAMGLIGSLIGALLGSFIQYFLPSILQDFLPFEVTLSPSPLAILRGILTGLLISVLFALIPLLAVRRVSPIRTLRANADEGEQKPDIWQISVYLAVVVFMFGFSWWQIGKPDEAAVFTVSILAAFGLLALVAQIIMWAVRKYFPTAWSYTWRQGMANLYRPHNQTLILVVSIGLGTSLITTLFFVQGLLIDQVSLSASENQPNMVLFDIQSPQKDEVHQLVRDFELPLIQKVPIVTMRTQAINGQTEADTVADIPDWAYTREHRVTYRDTLIDSETLIEGTWHGDKPESDSIFISMEKSFANRMGASLGDEIVFNVQGTPIKTYLSSYREVDWQRVQTNFLIVFPSGVLENAPQFHVVITRVQGDEQSAAFQQAVVQRFPNVSVIDLGLILRTLDTVLDKVSFAIRFMALFSIITGLIVLAGSVIISKYQRVQESVLLRTLGANRNQVLRINALEYSILGGLASLCGIGLAMLGSWALAVYNFEAAFVPNLLPALGVFVLITLVTVTIGLLNSRGVLSKPPLEILRSEG